MADEVHSRYYRWQIYGQGPLKLKRKSYYQLPSLNLVYTTDGQEICTGDNYYYCYLLQSANGRRTYFGMTDNVKRRLRQHNGEITGGAKATRWGRPWKLIAYIHGFVSRSEALSFEWHNHHPGKNLKGSGLAHRIKVLSIIIREGRWRRKQPIKTNIINIFWQSTIYQLDLNPSHIEIEYKVKCKSEYRPKYKSKSKYKSKYKPKYKPEYKPKYKPQYKSQYEFQSQSDFQPTDGSIYNWGNNSCRQYYID